MADLMEQDSLQEESGACPIIPPLGVSSLDLALGGALADSEVGHQVFSPESPGRGLTSSQFHLQPVPRS